MEQRNVLICQLLNIIVGLKSMFFLINSILHILVMTLAGIREQSNQYKNGSAIRRTPQQGEVVRGGSQERGKRSGDRIASKVA